MQHSNPKPTTQRKYSPILTSQGADELFSQTTAKDWVKYIGISLLICSAMILLFAMAGCTASKIAGGSSLTNALTENTQGGTQATFEVIIPTPAGPLTYRSGASTQPSTHSDSQYVSTTQPSAESTGNASTPRLTSNEDGEWSAWFDQRKVPLKSQWPLAILFLATAFACYQWGGNVLAAGACVGLAIIAVIMPAILVWMALLSVVVAIWSMRKSLVQLVRGNEVVLKATPPDLGEKLKSAWQGEHDETTQKVVKNVR